MLKRLKERFQASSLENGIDLSTKEMKELHKDLKQQLKNIEKAILHAVDRNNYVVFSDLVMERKRINIAINTIETTINQTHQRRFFSSSDITALSTILDNSLSSINILSRNITGNIINHAANSLSYSAQLSEQLQRVLQQSSTRLSQLSEQVIHQSKERKN